MLLGIAFTVYFSVTLLLSSTGSNLKAHPRNDMVNQAKDSSNSRSKDNDSGIIHPTAAAVNHYDLHYLLDTLRRELMTPSLYPEYYYDSKHPSRFTTTPSTSSSLSSSSSSSSSIEVVPLPVSSCRITYTIDPYAIAFYQDMLHDYKHQQLMSQRYRFDSDFREYLNEWLLLEFFLSSPCRINGTDDDDNDDIGRGSQGGNDINYRYDQQTRVSKGVRQPSMPLNNNNDNNNNNISNDLSTRSNPPNYHIIFLPFKYLLSIKQALSIATKRIITKVFMNAITSPSFEHHREGYILVHASTLNYKELFVNILTHYDEVIMYD